MPEVRSAFVGFEPLDANYVYCPNQFFDVCLPNCSRGTVRVVSYILRQTLGWLDKQGNPQRQEIQVRFCDLIDKAGVSRGAIGPALREALEAGFIECTITPVQKSQGQPGRTAAYSLCWDTGQNYETNADRFTGFFSGEGNRTPVPNSFFDSVVRNESLAVAKVVGTVIRNTIGYQNQFGGRRDSHPLSYNDLQRYTRLSDRSTLSNALRLAQQVGYIECDQPGTFSHNAARQQSASYRVCWLKEDAMSANGSKNRPDSVRFKKQTRNGSETRPEERSKNQTSKEKTIQNKNYKQPAAAELKGIESLTSEGFDRRTAVELIEKRGVGVVERQLDWIDARNPCDSRTGMLRKAIEEDWSRPAAIEQKERRHRNRERDRKAEAKQCEDDATLAAVKKSRTDRKQRLLVDWTSASRAEREQWIHDAVNNEASKIIADIIRRQGTQTDLPHVHVLDVVARQKNLPPVVDVSDQRSPDR